ncbi:two-component sensor histidine kinase [Myroides odoratimimus]|uniref:tetratricopeptide repeat-containing sensor histidine kinase n=2 Tax=Myroides odoratimimus TaxID=76832 RepID=UPI00258149E8|nr:ATP-binding protein [Myroides odoratimimus]MDM1064957.1 two-component sensor histidine kinase [Myroides odoratimimus]MDM1413108.1 two-component sensor histidine kinase [Myroides odoratimimus]MDM1447572.1 two-component sensor histidine kinase [Myroides odoratimimus]MEC4051657.1 ATP-binding protein [Myroides odoratimimus]
MFKLRVLYFAVLCISMSMIHCTQTETNKEDLKLEEINAFIKSYNRFNPTDKDKAAADSLGNVILNLRNTEQSRNALRKYILLTNADKQYIEELFKRSRKADDKKNEAQAYFLRGKRYAQNFQIDSTYYNYTKAEFLFKSIQDSVNLQEVYSHKAIILLNNKIFTEGQSQILKAMNVNKEHKDARIKYSESIIMANALVGLEQLPEALKQLELSLKLLDNPEIVKFFLPDAIRLNKITIYYNIAEVYIKQGEYKKAQNLIHNVIDKYINESTIYDEMMLAHLLYNLTQADIKSKQYDDVEKNLVRAIDIQLKNKNLQDYNSYKILLAEYFYLIKKEEQGNQLVNEVLEYAHQNNNLGLEKETLTVLLKYKKEQYNTNFVRYEELNKLILDENNVIKNTFARLSFEADSLERANEQLQNQKNIITMVSSALLVLAITIFFVILFRQKAKEVSLVKLFQKDTEKYYDSIINVQNELAEARNIERKEIAKELHDGVLNKLFVTRFLLMQVSKESVETHKDSLINEVKEVEQYIRDVSHVLGHEEDFKNKEFNELIRDLVGIQNRNQVTKFILFMSNDICFSRLSIKFKVHIYRIIQECLQNVQKHAKATECQVSILLREETRFEVIIKDNGVGFDTDIVKRGLGFTNIKARTQLMNSKINISSTEGKGTSISFTIDLNESVEC